MADHERPGRPDGAVAVVRRAPFSDNPRVGARGQRTQQRILDAALRAFGEAGYRGCSIDQITTLARCSRVSFYQYFANKEDVFRQLAGQVARQVSASTEALDPLTPDLDGWAALRAWVSRFGTIHARYEPVFHAFEGDEELAAVARNIGEESVTRIRARLETTTLPPRHLDPVLRLLLECLNRTLDITAMVRAVRTDGYPGPDVEVALTDVMHRTLFGVHDSVNVHAPDGAPPPALESGSAMFELIQPPGAIDPNAPNSRVLDALLLSGRDVFVERGYHNTRVEDLGAAAGVSHGAFYRYFRNKEELARMLTARAVEAVGTTVNEIPDISTLDETAGRSMLRRWLSRYHIAHMNEARMMRVWIDAALQGPQLRTESAPIFDWGRRRMARWLHPRGFGDVDMDAVVLVALLSVFGARQRSAAEIDAAVLVVERGLLGRSS
jgi:AcrR family transcriptional regulator